MADVPCDSVEKSWVDGACFQKPESITRRKETAIGCKSSVKPRRQSSQLNVAGSAEHRLCPGAQCHLLCNIENNFLTEFTTTRLNHAYSFLRTERCSYYVYYLQHLVDGTAHLRSDQHRLLVKHHEYLRPCQEHQHRTLEALISFMIACMYRTSRDVRPTSLQMACQPRQHSVVRTRKPS